MASKQLSLVHLVQYPASYSKEAYSKYPTILALHGRGSNEEDLIGLASYLPDDFLWISPRGTFELGPDGYEWFQVIQIGKPDPIRLANAITTIDHFIEEVIDSYPIDIEKLYLLGFSQGTVVSLSYALTKPQRVAGVIAQSGYLPQESGLHIDEAGVKDKPFLLTHGIQDQLIPLAWARRTRDTLEQLGVNMEYHEFNMGHQITADSLEVVSAWLEKQVDK
jgi:phospholipase/carboxylesterase